VTNEEMARAYLSQAEEILREVERLYQRQAWNLVVRRSQEVVELALKGLLRGAGVEVPRTHDVGVWLKSYRDRFPASLPIGDRPSRFDIAPPPPGTGAQLLWR
jgi:Uncharacterized conserved protein related to C-terminal domain of eukaryotic chaperone, SACSIN